jgi:hypothetical protein
MPKTIEKKTGVEIGTHYPMVIECFKYTNPALAKKQKQAKQAQRADARSQSQLGFSPVAKDDKTTAPKDPKSSKR